MSNVAIKVENLSKQYRLGLVGTGTLSHDLNRFWHRMRGKEDPYLKLGETNDRTVKGSSDYVWALKDIDFEVKQGEVLGIIGRNGAGKSTLLKVLSKVTTPTTGSIHLKGRIASLLEVGTGFHPELTGRENIFLNGAILGMTKSEIRSKFDEIVDFSGVERYIDTPVKRYSSGMYVRLAFAVAAHLEPEVLIVDEVLAVGDIEFQKKCLGKMKEVGDKDGRTVLFVSHNMGSIKALCKNGLLMENGTIRCYDQVDIAIQQYFKKNSSIEGEFTPGRLDSSEKVVIQRVVISNQYGTTTESFKIGDDMVVEFTVEAPEEIVLPYIWLGITSMYGPVSTANTLLDGCRISRLKKGENVIKCTFKGLPLLPQEYHIMAGIRGGDGQSMLMSSKQIGFFVINSTLKDVGLVGEMAENIATETASPIIPYEWDFGNGEKYSFNILDNVKR
jgi:lipopolysaccharide transport system ATP-binding protein